VEYKIPDLVRMVERGEIEVPEIQREFVWSENQVRDLAESIYKNYPIGLITLYKLPEKYRHGKVEYWVLDGQQRLLSLTLIVKGKIEAVRKGKLQTIRLNIWFDPKTERFEIRSPKKGENWIKLPELLEKNETSKLIKYLREKNLEAEEQDKVQALWLRFRGDYKVLVHELPEDLDLDDLGNIFVRTNFAGTRVKGSDVYSTIIAISEKNLVKELRNFCGKLLIDMGYDIDYGILIRTFIAFLTEGNVKLASRVLDQAKKLKEVIENNKGKIKNIIKSVESCVYEAIKLIRDEMGIMSSSERYLPTENVIPVIAYYIHKRKMLSEDEKKGLLKWFVMASYFRRYSSSAETRLNEDLKVIEKGGSYKDLIKKLEEYEGNLKERIKEDLLKGRFNELLLYAILKQNDARDLLTHERLNTGNLTIHHIFPKKYLIGSKYEEVLDDIGNITLVSSSTNQRLSSELPENYLRRIPKDIRNSHLIPHNQDLWKLENCKKFIEERKELLMKAIETFFEI